jgi:hypothetical protein
MIKMEEQNLRYSKSCNTYFFINEYKDCEVCKNNIENSIIILSTYTRKTFNKHYYCLHCAKKIPSTKSMIVTSRIVATITSFDELPKDSIFVLDNKPSLAPMRNMSNFDLALCNLEGEKNVDKTNLALRESFEGSSIGDSSIISKLEKKDSLLLSVDDGMDLLNSLAKATPMIEYKEKDKKLLTDK